MYNISTTQHITWTGTLREGRHKASLIQTSHYLSNCIKEYDPISFSAISVLTSPSKYRIKIKNKGATILNYSHHLPWILFNNHQNTSSRPFTALFSNSFNGRSPFSIHSPFLILNFHPCFGQVSVQASRASSGIYVA